MSTTDGAHSTTHSPQNRIGEELLMTVERGGVVIGSAKPTVKPGDPAFEVGWTVQAAGTCS